MDDKAEYVPSTFDQAALGVSRRILLARWVRGLRKTAIPMALIGAEVVIILRLMGARWADLWLVLPVLLGWVAVVYGISWWRCPRGGEALGVWDNKTDRGEAFLSAHCFEAQPDPTVGQRLHIQRAAAVLAKAWCRLRSDLPLGFDHRIWIAPLILLLFTASPLLISPLAAEDRPLDADAKAQVVSISELIEQRRDMLDELRGLDPDEQEKVDELKEKLDETARKLKEADVESRRDALAQIESLANAVDKLAASLGDSDSEATATSGMIEELERHTDTASFGSSLRTNETVKKAKEAEKLAGRLDDDGLTLDEKQRFKDAFDKAIKAANDHDLKTPEGKAVDVADREIKADEPKQAAEAFRKLAKAFDRQAKREAAADRLKQLAQDFRAGGQKLVNPNQGQMRQLAAAGQQNNANNGAMRRLGGQPLAPNPMAAGQQPFQNPNAGNAGPQPPGGQAPIPGGQPPAAGGQPPPVPGGQLPGAGQFPGGQMPAMAGGGPPIPGTGQVPGGGPLPGAGQVPGAGQTPGAGLSQGSGVAAGQVPGAVSGVGGQQAGSGSAALGGDPTQSREASTARQVNVGPRTPGASQVREIESAPRREETARQSRQAVSDFIASEQAALEAEELPLMRRDQIRRYFIELHQQYAGDTP
ncbi:MAG: hypothetical protein AAGB26_07520 [Planctomycetota bacterium]